MGTEEQRNFRSAYYEKVGCRSVEEKKTLERLLKEKPIELDRIEEFARRFVLPSAYREPVWTLLLDISSKYEQDKFVILEQSKLSNSLERALYFMDLIDENTSKHKQLTLMYLLEQGKLSLDVESQLLSSDAATILEIAKVFENLTTPFINDYWIMRQFIFKLETLSTSAPELIIKCKKNLPHHDGQLFQHLSKTGAIDCLPLDIWFQRCFAGFLHESSVIRLWDRAVIGGSYQKMLPLVAMLMLSSNKQHILTKHKVQEIRTLLLKPLPLEASELVYTQLMEICDTAKLR